MSRNGGEGKGGGKKETTDNREKQKQRKGKRPLAIQYFLL